MDPDPINSNSRLRASDRERDQAASVINEALAQGMITPEEHAERLDAIYAAKTRADLVPVLDDLPQRGPHAVPAPAAPPGAPAGPADKLVCVFSGTSRKGIWRPRPVIEALTVFGGAELDFREALLPGREVSIRAITVFGGLQITIPPEMRVVDSTVTIFGGTEVAGDSAESQSPDAPVLYLSGSCVFGGVEVKRKERIAGNEPVRPGQPRPPLRPPGPVGRDLGPPGRPALDATRPLELGTDEAEDPPA